MEFDDIVVKENPGLCRCCLSEGCYKDLGSEYAWMNDTEVYADMLLECFDISISQINEGPNGPNRLICEVCITRLRDACNFKKQVLECEKKFIDMVARGEFRKVIIYQEQMKAEEQDDDLPVDDYLEDPDFEDDEPLKREPQPTVSAEPLKVKSKRGRPKKYIEIKTDKKKTKTDEKKTKTVAKDVKPTKLEEMSEFQRKTELSNFLTLVIENSRALPFRWFSNKFTCFFCRSTFIECSRFKQHMKEEHEQAKLTKILRSLLGNCRLKLDISDVSCRLCSKHINDFEGFLDHASNVHNLPMNNDMRRGVMTFKLSDDMACDVCGEKFRFFSNLLKHTQKYHNKSGTFLCEICGQGFVAKEHVDRHVDSVHGEKIEIECHKCHKTFPSRKSLKYHDDVTHKHPELKCNICHKVFRSIFTRNRHLALVHDEKSLQFRCDECPLVFVKNFCLVSHKARVHLKEKTATCQICGMKLFDDRALQLHMVRHSDARPFECEFCKKTFQRKSTLIMHRRIHTNDKRCVCKECGKAFIQTTSLKLHIRVHHPGLERR